MEKRYGATERHDRLMQIGRNTWELIYGYGTDGENGWTWRERYSRKPTLEEIKATIIAQINANTDERILSGMTWRGAAVWLSTENQFNYKAAYDLAVQTAGATLPVTFKLGTDDEPQYHTFESLDELQEFYTAALAHVQKSLSDGWTEKDGMDWSVYE